jgi:2-iminobutanoate/2-iminopropanoate deaminase
VKYISTRKAPTPAGHYAQATVLRDMVFVSGQLPVDPETGAIVPGTITEQTEQVLQNVEAILEAAGSGIGNVLKTTIYIADIELWGEVNAIYGRHFGKHRPARAVVPAPTLHHGALIEMEAIAYIPG